ncbi:MAG: LemA family protein [Candidatus Paceibacterota bacterium]
MTWILIAIIVVIVLWLFITYNGLVTGRNRSEEAWADIEVQLKRRYDLIPNLVNTVKGYATHESGTFEKVTEARNKAMLAQGTAGAAQAEGELAGTLKSLFAVSEAYPELKANTNFLELQRELSDTENKIQASRRFYNGNVRDYNTKIDISPSNLVAHLFGFQKKNYFDLPDNDAAQNPVEVTF